MEFIQQNKEIILSITIGIVFAYIIMFFLRLFFGNSAKEDMSEIRKLLENQNDILEKQNVYGVYTFKDIIEEIRNLGENSELKYTMERIEEHLENIERFTKLTEEHTCILRNDYHYKHYYEKGCYDGYCRACQSLKDTERFNKEFPPTPPQPPEEDIEQDPTQ